MPICPSLSLWFCTARGDIIPALFYLLALRCLHSVMAFCMRGDQSNAYLRRLEINNVGKQDDGGGILFLFSLSASLLSADRFFSLKFLFSFLRGFLRGINWIKKENLEETIPSKSLFNSRAIRRIICNNQARKKFVARYLRAL